MITLGNVLIWAMAGDPPSEADVTRISSPTTSRPSEPPPYTSIPVNDPEECVLLERGEVGQVVVSGELAPFFPRKREANGSTDMCDK